MKNRIPCVSNVHFEGSIFYLEWAVITVQRTSLHPPQGIDLLDDALLPHLPRPDVEIEAEAGQGVGIGDHTRSLPKKASTKEGGQPLPLIPPLLLHPSWVHLSFESFNIQVLFILQKKTNVVNNVNSIKSVPPPGPLPSRFPAFYSFYGTSLTTTGLPFMPVFMFLFVSL